MHPTAGTVPLHPPGLLALCKGTGCELLRQLLVALRALAAWCVCVAAPRGWLAAHVCASKDSACYGGTLHCMHQLYTEVAVHVNITASVCVYIAEHALCHCVPDTLNVLRLWYISGIYINVHARGSGDSTCTTAHWVLKCMQMVQWIGNTVCTPAMNSNTYKL